jgi:hypothetical protein
MVWNSSICTYSYGKPPWVIKAKFCPPSSLLLLSHSTNEYVSSTNRHQQLFLVFSSTFTPTTDRYTHALLFPYGHLLDGVLCALYTGGRGVDESTESPLEILLFLASKLSRLLRLRVVLERSTGAHVLAKVSLSTALRKQAVSAQYFLGSASWYEIGLHASPTVSLLPARVEVQNSMSQVLPSGRSGASSQKYCAASCLVS